MATGSLRKRSVGHPTLSKFEYWQSMIVGKQGHLLKVTMELVVEQGLGIVVIVQVVDLMLDLDCLLGLDHVQHFGSSSE